MDSSGLLLGIALMVLGVVLITVAVFRALNHSWGLGLHEMWVLPAAGIGLILLGRWLLA
jgi:hypothetical protein